MEIWNSPETLGKINTALQIALVLFGILTGLLGATSFVISHRKSTLDSISDGKFKSQVETIEDRTSDVKELVGRTLTAEQREKIVRALTGTASVKVLAVRHNSKESQKYSSQIENALKEVGWDVDQFLIAESTRQVSSPKIGLNDEIEQLQQFDALKDAMNSAELEFSYDRFSGNFDKDLILDVGVIPANDYQTMVDKIQ